MRHVMVQENIFEAVGDADAERLATALVNAGADVVSRPCLAECGHCGAGNLPINETVVGFLWAAANEGVLLRPLRDVAEMQSTGAFVGEGGITPANMRACGVIR